MRIGEMSENLKQMIEWMREDFHYSDVSRFNVDGNTIRLLIDVYEFIILFDDEENWCSVQAWNGCGSDDLASGDFGRGLYVKMIFDILDYALADQQGHIKNFVVLDGNRVVFICSNEAEMRSQFPNHTLVPIRRSDTLERLKQRFPDWDWSILE
jgi:hypothetical protein